MRCPIVSGHTMLEIAPGLHQCPDCGAGPTLFWALSHVENEDGACGAVSVAYQPLLHGYTVSYTTWTTDLLGKRLPDTVRSTPIGYLSTPEELQESPLPVVGREGEVVHIRAGMFSSPLGEKTSQSTGRRGKSGAAPFRTAEAAPGYPPRRRRRVG